MSGSGIGNQIKCQRVTFDRLAIVAPSNITQADVVKDIEDYIVAIVIVGDGAVGLALVKDA